MVFQKAETASNKSQGGSLLQVRSTKQPLTPSPDPNPAFLQTSCDTKKSFIHQSTKNESLVKQFEHRSRPKGGETSWVDIKNEPFLLVNNLKVRGLFEQVSAKHITR